MKKFRAQPLAWIAGGCLIALTIPAYRWLDAERANVGAIPREVRETRSVLVAKAGELAQGVDRHARQLEGRLDGRLASIEGRLFAEVHQAVNDPAGPVGTVIARADARLGETTAALETAAAAVGTAAAGVRSAADQVGGTVAELRPGFRNGSLMAAEVREALAPMLDCRGNAACLPSETTGILGGTKTLLGEAALTTRAWRKEAPATAAAVRGIAGNGEKISRPSKLWTVVKYVAPIAGAVIAAKAAH